jgi:hypothetical protein
MHSLAVCTVYPESFRAACERRRQNAPLFTHVVHIAPEAVLAAYGEVASRSANEVQSHLQAGRLLSLQKWVEHLHSGS